MASSMNGGLEALHLSVPGGWWLSRRYERSGYVMIFDASYLLAEEQTLLANSP